MALNYIIRRGIFDFVFRMSYCEHMNIIQTTAQLSLLDKWGSFKVRWGIGRHVYLVDPGLYALGSPDENSPVIVTANYKYTFDIVRSKLPGLNLYILVLDTKGVNVWCAAGKGTFGTEELITRIQAVDLGNIVTHHTVILPQLGAVGVAAHEIKKQTGFKVVYGPVRAEDLPDFLKNEMNATADMRQVRFTLWDRMVLVPIEIVSYAAPALLVAAFLVAVSIFHKSGISFNLSDMLFIVCNVFLAYLSGVAITPILLPWIPFRSFSAKGAIVGLFIVAILNVAFTPWILIIPTISSFLAMNFTGSSTYTSLSGVKKEMGIAVPIQIAAMVVGIVWLVAKNFL